MLDASSRAMSTNSECIIVFMIVGFLPLVALNSTGPIHPPDSLSSSRASNFLLQCHKSGTPRYYTWWARSIERHGVPPLWALLSEIDMITLCGVNIPKPDRRIPGTSRVQWVSDLDIYGMRRPFWSQQMKNVIRSGDKICSNALKQFQSKRFL